MGPQFLIVDSEAICGSSDTCSDPLALRAELGSRVGWRVGEATSLYLTGGASVDVATKADVDGNKESARVSPRVGLGISF